MSDDVILRFFKHVHAWLIFFGFALAVVSAWYHWPLLIAFGTIIVVFEVFPAHDK